MNILGYNININKIIFWSILFLAGLIDGILEGYGFDGRTSFERKFGRSKTGYFGSESWLSAYKNHDVTQGFKSSFVKIIGAQDFYHNADDLRKLLYMIGSFLLGMFSVNTKRWHYIIDFIISFTISAVGKAIGMYYIRL